MTSQNQNFTFALHFCFPSGYLNNKFIVRYFKSSRAESVEINNKSGHEQGFDGVGGATGISSAPSRLMLPPPAMKSALEAFPLSSRVDNPPSIVLSVD